MVLGGEQPTLRGPSAAMGAVRGPVTQGAQRVTTLSGASGQVSALPPKSGKAGLFAVAAVLLAAGAGGAFYFLRGGHQPTVVGSRPDVTEPRAAEPAAQKPEMVTITISSEPSGAKVIRTDGEVVGLTPVDLKLKRGDPSFDVQLRRQGYKPQIRSVTPNVSKEVVVPLVPDGTTPEVKAAAAAPAPKPKVKAVRKKVPTGNDLDLMPPPF
jgi:hypothetical protein